MPGSQLPSDVCEWVCNNAKYGTSIRLLLERFIPLYRIHSITSDKRSHPRFLQQVLNRLSCRERKIVLRKLSKLIQHNTNLCFIFRPRTTLLEIACRVYDPFPDCCLTNKKKIISKNMSAVLRIWDSRANPSFLQLDYVYMHLY